MSKGLSKGLAPNPLDPKSSLLLPVSLPRHRHTKVADRARPRMDAGWPGNSLLSLFDKNSLRGKMSIRKTGLNVKTKRSQAMEEGFRPVWQITIIK